ncbi:Putative teichuronic acid biosynthesis glycosyltransferase TuaC [Anaerohalosphaera lusitana]|uniref:Putative teichuronic acid biosynthesis glycosyltransferase TuaC n=2 Tax=Anaerohalosphaera lusitana TaxID=1936003 RepID=A0A1U9NS48_9BACT|nr:Putative teichuronic acid biosynthesis glycosyltransferase TuaC [Anaerohalosphaera lusitana]
MRTIELMPYLRQRGIRLDFCTLSNDTAPGSLDSLIKQHGGDVLQCPLKLQPWSFHHRLKNILKEGNYDAVHSHVFMFSGYVAFIAKQANIRSRVVHFRTTSDGGKKRNFSRKGYNKAMHYLVDKYATDILAVCIGAMEVGWRVDWRQDPRCKIVYNGIDVSKFQRKKDISSEVRCDLNLPQQSKLVVCVGRLIPDKSQNVLIDAAPEILGCNPDTHVLFVGDGPERSSLSDKVVRTSLEQRIHFLGTRTDVPELLLASDCFVLPSKREGLPGVVLEALMANLPVVATDLPGVREIQNYAPHVKIVPFGDSHALAREVSKSLCRNEHLHIHDRFYEAFDLKTCAEKLADVYEESLEG